MGRRLSDVPLSRISNVFPEDTPVLRLVPDIGPLVHGNNELDPSIEEVIDSLSGRLLHDVEG